jgi:Tol biopolymer transport system component/DNA-binding winged helix-turn-helix (wHTH) protein
MHPPDAAIALFRFGPFELNAKTGELRRNGVRVRLPDQSCSVLLALLRCPGEMVSREDLQQQLWKSGTFVDFEHGLNLAVARLRQALGDTAEHPRYIETLPRKGYRFLVELAAVEERKLTSIEIAPLQTAAIETAPIGLQPIPAPPRGARRRHYGGTLAAILLALAISGSIYFRQRFGSSNANLRLRQVTADIGIATMPALSPDGKLVAYASDRGTGGNLDIWVQTVAEGGRPIRLTHDSGNDTDPSFSPDGGKIVFVSQRQGGGIYVIPALGGDERLLVRGGAHPRFSPDGTQIAYSTTPSEFMDLEGPGLYTSNVSVVPASGGPSRVVAPELGWANFRSWSADGKLLLIAVMRAVNSVETLEYWVAGANGGRAVPTNILRELSKRNLPTRSISLDWSQQGLLVGAGTEIWRFELDPRDWNVRTARRLFTAPSQISRTRGTPSKLVFSSATTATHLWRLPIDLNSGRVTGPLSPVPNAGGSQIYPSLSHDGNVLVYQQSSPSGDEVLLRDNAKGTEAVLIGQLVRPKLSPDGSRVAFSNSKGLYLLDSGGGQPKALMQTTERLVAYGWSPDGERVVFWHGSPVQFSTIEWRTGKRKVLISHPKYSVLNAVFSPDENWLSFDVPGPTGRRVMIAPVRDGTAAAESEWITVAAASNWNQRGWWSEDGRLLFYLSDRDRSTCIWAQHLAIDTKRPVGDAFPVSHFHDMRRLLPGAGPYGPAVSRNELLVGLQERTENIWLAEESP